MKQISQVYNMSSLRFASFIYPLLSLVNFLPQTAFGALFHICSNSGNFSPNDPYEANLNNLTGNLSIQAPPSGFGLSSTGKHPNRAYGLALCRGDASRSDCKTCVVEAGSEIRKRCPYNKGAIIWYDNCVFKYSNVNFFGRIDNDNKFYMRNMGKVSDPEPFNRQIKGLISELANDASAYPEALYAAGEMKVYGSIKIYGLTQCTRDLSSNGCKRCLEGIIGELPSCCDGRKGGRIITGSCNFIYEIYPIVNDS